MTKDKSEKKEKRDKKAKKEKRSDKDGVHKLKKDKKEKKLEDDEHVTTALLNALDDNAPESAADTAMNGVVSVNSSHLIGALVPFANPLADEKAQKRALRSVKKAAKNKCLKRGVKEVVKALRKTSLTTPQGANPPSVVILAADISPMDVISHIPVLCEDHNIPYLFVKSRAELGAAGNTKRPTSVVMITPEPGGKKKADAKAEPAEGEEDFKEVYKDLVKMVEKEARNVRV